MLNKLIVFDLDGTLAESKVAIDAEMGDLLNQLLQLAKVAIISGGDWPQFQEQVLSVLPQKQYLKNLVILPTCDTKYYQYRSGWKILYADNFTAEQRKTIIENLQQAVIESGLKTERIWGAQIEDRGKPDHIFSIGTASTT